MSVLPAAFFVYNRLDTAERTLACLRDAGVSRIYAFSDGPRSSDDAAAVEAVRALVRAVDWAEVSLVERERNVGLSASITRGLDAVFEREERALVVEDDVAIAPEFPEFAAAALDRYADDDSVFCVMALRLPFRRRPVDRYPHDAFFLPRFHALGWATWRSSWRGVDLDRDSLLRRLREGGVRTEVAGADVPYMIRKALVEGTLTDAWDVSVAASVLLDRKLVLWPAWNMVELVAPGTGTHAVTPHWTLRWEVDKRPAGRPSLPPVELEPAILKSFQVFRENPRGWTPRRLVPRPLRQSLRRLRRTYAIFR